MCIQLTTQPQRHQRQILGAPPNTFQVQSPAFVSLSNALKTAGYGRRSSQTNRTAKDHQSVSCCPRQQRQFSICQPTQRTRGSISNYHQLQAGNAKQSDTRPRSCVKNSPRILMSSADIGHGSTQAVNVRATRHVTCVLALHLKMTIQSFC